MNTSMNTLLKIARSRVWIGCLSALLLACHGTNSSTNFSTAPDSNNTSNPASGGTTTLGTRLALSQNNPAVTDNASAKWKKYSRAADYPDIVELPLQFITLKSGQKLGVLVGLPADAHGNVVAGTFPAILTQNAYRIDVGNMLSSIIPAGSTLMTGGADRFIIRRGYVTVCVDVLGSGVSDGEGKLLGADEQAAYGEAVDWVLQQPWSNGKIGLAGTSYLGITALLTAEQRNPAVKAVFVDVPMGDAWRGIIGTGGMLNALFLSYWLPLTQSLSVTNGNAVKAYPQFAAQINAATQQHIASIDSFYLPMIDQALAGEPGYATDGDFWSVRSPIEHAADIPVPTFLIGASSDIFQRDEPLLYEQMKKNVTTKLLIVPGAHTESLVSSLISNDNPREDGAPASMILLLQWFDKYIKGIDSGAEKQPTITQYVSGYGENGRPRYAVSSDWPHPQAMPQRLYLHGDLSLTTEPPSAVEVTHTVAEPTAPTLKVSKNRNGSMLRDWLTTADGSDKSISYLQWSLGFALPFASYFKEDNTVEKLQNAINYETAVMTSDYYVNGPIQADIWMSSTVTEAALSIRVDDIQPDGTALPLTNGLMAASQRAVDTSRSRYLRGEMIQPWHPFTAAATLPVSPGEIIKVPVEIFPVAALIRTGHKLRISISASNQSQGIWSTPAQVKANGGISTIYSDSNHLSSVVLPVVPASVLN